MYRFGKVVFAVLLIWLAAGSFAFCQTIRLAVVPFGVEAQNKDEYSFLQKGVYTMLSSRLGDEAQIDILPKAEVEKALSESGTITTEAQAKALGEKLGTDYVLIGNLFVIGQDASLDAKLVPVKIEKPVQPYHITSKINTLIPDIDGFCQKMKPDILGSKPQSEAELSSSVKTMPNGFIQNVPKQSLEDKESMYNYWKSENLRYVITGIAISDIDNDGKKEVIILSPETVYVYDYKDGHLHEKLRFGLGSYLNPIGLDIADINQNGLPEIFITCFNSHRTRFRSWVLEYKNGKLKPIFEDMSWAFRVVDLQQQKMLLGQRSVLNEDNPFSSEIFEMKWNGSQYLPQKTLLDKEDVGLLGISSGQVTGPGIESMIAYAQNGALEVLDLKGEVLWAGSEPYGESMLYVSLPKTDPDFENREYLSLRTITRKSVNKGTTEVLAIKNYEQMGNVLHQFKNYTDSRIVSFSWDGLGLSPNWQTRKITGYISDFAVEDFDRDGKKECVAGLVIKQSSFIFSKPKSVVIAFEIE